MERARRGDPDAWEVLYRRAYPGLLAYARARLGPHAADDAVSETMLRAVQRIATYRWRGVDFTGWLFGIHRHVVTDALRARRRPRHSPVAETVMADPADRLVRDDEAAQLRQAFERLRPADREVLALRIIAELTVEQAAATLGVSTGAVRVRQCRALQRLRALCEEEETR